MLAGPHIHRAVFPANHRVSWLTLPKAGKEQKAEKNINIIANITKQCSHQRIAVESMYVKSESFFTILVARKTQ